MTDDLSQLQAEVENIKAQLANLQAIVDEHSAGVGRIANLSESLDELIVRFNELFPPDDPDAEYYRIEPSPLFWRLRDEERGLVIADLRQWVGEVYRENFGHLAAHLPECWTEHNLILTITDIIKELHSVLYLRPRSTQRQVTNQAELFSRFVPALVALASAEAKNCEHSRSRLNRQFGGAA
jgi:hypothetical protein